MKTELTAAECIAALRHCTDDGTELCVDDQYRCPLWNEDRMTDCCKADLMLAAADRIEAQHLDGVPVSVAEIDAYADYLNCPHCGCQIEIGERIEKKP